MMNSKPSKCTQETIAHKKESRANHKLYKTISKKQATMINIKYLINNVSALIMSLTCIKLE